MEISYYTIFDEKKHESTALFPASSDEEAKRICVNMYSNPSLDVRANVRDLSLYLIGTFTTRTVGNPEYEDDRCFGFLSEGETLPNGTYHPNVKLGDFVDFCGEAIQSECSDIAALRDEIYRLTLTVDSLRGATHE